jgi:ankyrin repeat protein
MDLIAAIRADFLEFAKLLIESSADVNYKDSKGRTALFFAVVYGLFDICNLLLDHGADVNQNTNSITPLMNAIYNSRIDIIKLLLVRGANIHPINVCGNNALNYAFDRYDFYVVRILYWRGAKCSNGNINGLLLLAHSRVLPLDIVRDMRTKLYIF